MVSFTWRAHLTKGRDDIWPCINPQATHQDQGLKFTLVRTLMFVFSFLFFAPFDVHVSVGLGSIYPLWVAPPQPILFKVNMYTTLFGHKVFLVVF